MSTINFDSTKEVAVATDPKKRAAVIDDAFDDVVPGEITVEDFKEFYQIVNEDNWYDTLMEQMGIAFDLVDFDDSHATPFVEHLQMLWKSRPSNLELKEKVDVHLFSDKVSKLAELDLICQNLELQNISVQKFQSNIEDLTIFKQNEFVYIFLDCNLGVKPGAEAINHAKSIARGIYESCPHGSKPITVLMSSDPKIESLKDTFQREAGLLEGVFRFSEKRSLGNEKVVSLLIKAYADEFQSNHVLQSYIKVLVDAANNAQKDFINEIQLMKIEDYVFLQNSILLNQQQPLGDYLSWLYGSHWGNLLLRNTQLKEEQNKIDKLIASQAPIHHTLPSPHVWDIYKSAVFEEGLNDVEYHPWEGLQKEVEQIPWLHLGDLFVNNASTTVWMIINPQCDLERPNSGMLERSVLLVPGNLISLDTPVLKTDHKTDFFSLHNERFRIKWNVKQVITIPFSKFIDWQQQNSYKREYRLRLPFALEVQQVFASSISRVGLPVSPPFTRQVILEVLFEDEEKSITKLVNAKSEYAFMPITSANERLIRLTLSFALDFKESLIRLYEQLLTKEGDQKTKWVEKKISLVGELLDKYDEWFFEHRTGSAYPEETKVKLLFPKYISVALNLNDAKPFQQAPFVINVVTKQSSLPAAVDNTITPNGTDKS